MNDDKKYSGESARREAVAMSAEERAAADSREAERAAERATERVAAEMAEKSEKRRGKRRRFRDDHDMDDLVDVLRAENKELKERHLLLAADMENLRKRTEREKADMAKYAISDFARDILTLSDNFQRAISAVSPEAAEQDETLQSFLEGVQMNERELQRVLERHGVTRINPEGQRFDPNCHQAVQQIDNPDVPNNTVCDVYQVGYMIGDRVLRNAVVAVAKGGPKLPPPLEVTEAGETCPGTTEEAGGNAFEDNDDMGSTVDKNV